MLMLGMKRGMRRGRSDGIGVVSGLQGCKIMG